MNILLTAANSDVAEAMARLLAQTFPGCRLFGAEAGDRWPAASWLAGVERLPFAVDPTYPAALAALSAKLGADLVIPVSEPEIARLARNPGAAAGLPLLMLSADMVLRFLDKLETALWLTAHGLPAPATRLLAEADVSQLPLVVKPRCGRGSSGVEVVASRQRLEAVRAEAQGEYVAQDYLEPPDQEYTCPLVRLGGETRAIVLRRGLSGGTTMWVEVADLPEVQAMLVRLAETLALDGALNVQLRLTAQGARIFEINPRFSGTVMMRHQLGFCDLEWTLRHRLGQPLPPYVPPATGSRVFRLSREVVVPPAGSPSP